VHGTVLLLLLLLRQFSLAGSLAQEGSRTNPTTETSAALTLVRLE